MYFSSIYGILQLVHNRETTLIFVKIKWNKGQLEQIRNKSLTFYFYTYTNIY